MKRRAQEPKALIVAEDDERGNEAEAEDSRPLLIQCVLSDKDLGRLKHLRVLNMMKL